MKPALKNHKVKWTEVVIKDAPDKRCDHRFQFNDEGECKCKFCGLGLMGVVDLQNGRPV